jgi:hypothetical protein
LLHAQKKNTPLAKKEESEKLLFFDSIREATSFDESVFASGHGAAP